MMRWLQMYQRVVPELHTIFRARYGHGQAAFGVLGAVHRGAGVTGTVYQARRLRRDDPRLSFERVAAEGIDLLNLRDSAWAPVFVSRIRQQARASRGGRR